MYGQLEHGVLSVFASDEMTKAIERIHLDRVQLVSTGGRKTKEPSSFQLMFGPHLRETRFFRFEDPRLYQWIRWYVQEAEAVFLESLRSSAIPVVRLGWIRCMHLPDDNDKKSPSSPTADLRKRSPLVPGSSSKNQEAGSPSLPRDSGPGIVPRRGLTPKGRWVYWYVQLTPTKLRFFREQPQQVSALDPLSVGVTVEYLLFGGSVRPLLPKESGSKKFAFGLFDASGIVVPMRATSSAGLSGWCESIHAQIVASLLRRMDAADGVLSFPCREYFPKKDPRLVVAVNKARAALAAGDLDQATMSRIGHALDDTAFFYAPPPSFSRRRLDLSLTGLVLHQTLPSAASPTQTVWSHTYEQLRVIRVVNRMTIELDFGRFQPVTYVLHLDQPMHVLKFVLADIIRLKKQSLEALQTSDP